jgi:anti-sigma factor RsiW
MSHEELRELLAGAALDILAEAEHREVLAHVQGCAECAAELDEYRATTGELALLLREAQMSDVGRASARRRLVARARAGDARRPGRGWRRGWAGWIVAAGLAGVLLMHHAVHRPVDYGWLAAGGVTVVLVLVGIYARVQRARVVTLERRAGGREDD